VKFGEPHVDVKVCLRFTILACLMIIIVVVLLNHLKLN